LQASLHVAARVLASRCTALAAWRAFDTPLGRGGLPRRLVGSATRCSDAYRDGTSTRWKSAARIGACRSWLLFVTAHHGARLTDRPPVPSPPAPPSPALGEATPPGRPPRLVGRTAPPGRPYRRVGRTKVDLPQPASAAWSAVPRTMR